MLLKELCTPDVVFCSADTNVLAAARLMRDRHVGDVVVVDDPESDQIPLGLVTDRDIVVQVLGKGIDPARTTVREIMLTPVVVGHTSEDASVAIERMKKHGIRRLPVLDENSKLAGIVSIDDLLRQLAADATALAEIIAREQSREHRTRR